MDFKNNYLNLRYQPIIFLPKNTTIFFILLKNIFFENK